jgi:hypothetical protein
MSLPTRMVPWRADLQSQKRRMVVQLVAFWAGGPSEDLVVNASHLQQLRLYLVALYIHQKMLSRWNQSLPQPAVVLDFHIPK